MSDADHNLTTRIYYKGYSTGKSCYFAVCSFPVLEAKVALEMYLTADEVHTNLTPPSFCYQVNGIPVHSMNEASRLLHKDNAVITFLISRQHIVVGLPRFAARVPINELNTSGREGYPPCNCQERRKQAASVYSLPICNPLRVASLS